MKKIMKKIYGFIYRGFMQLMHYYGWHYAPIEVLQDGKKLRWCYWCGFKEIQGTGLIVGKQCGKIGE